MPRQIATRFMAGVLGAGLLLAGAPASAGPAPTTPSPAEASIARGQALVQRNCGMCHAIGPVGDSPNPLAPHFRELHERYPVEDLAEALGEGIIVGHPLMPELRFSSEEVTDIIAYLESIQTNRHAAAGHGERKGG